MTFDVIHVYDQIETTILPNVDRGKALEYVDNYVAPGFFSGRVFQQAAVNRYKSLDKKAEVIIRPRS